MATVLELAGRLFAHTIRALGPEQLRRTIVYAWLQETRRTLAWVAARVLHETEHHAADVERLAAR